MQAPCGPTLIIGEAQSYEPTNLPMSEDKANFILHRLAFNETNLADRNNYDVVDQNQESILNVVQIPDESALAQALGNWFGYGWNPNKIARHLRSGIHEGNCMYFMAGSGYDRISQDMLGGKVDGQAQRDFAKFLTTGRKPVYKQGIAR